MSGGRGQIPAGPAKVRGGVRIIDQDPCVIHRCQANRAKQLIAKQVHGCALQPFMGPGNGSRNEIRPRHQWLASRQLTRMNAIVHQMAGFIQ
jgi:hypothetical protein